jgi:class 3 adenylate cyclase
MGEVQARIIRLQGAGYGGSAPSPKGSRGLAYRTSQTTPAHILRLNTSTAISSERNDGWLGGSGKCNFVPRVPFRRAVLATVVIGVLMTGGLMFVPLEIFSEDLHSATLESFEDSVQAQVSVMTSFTEKTAKWYYSFTLESICGNISRSVISPSDHAVDVIWGTMRTQRAVDPAFHASEPGPRRMLQHRALLELQDQLGDGASRVNHAYAGFPGDQMAGAILLEEHLAELMDADGGDAPLNISFTKVDPFTYEAINVTWEYWEGPTQRPWYQLQADIAEDFPEGRPRRAWSRLYPFLNGELGLTRTFPVAYCGNYSCLEGVVASDITLPILNDICQTALDGLQASTFKNAALLTAENCGVFVVNQVSERFPDQEGILVAESFSSGQGIINATDSQNDVISRTSRALLGRFQNWSSPGLLREQHFTFDGDFESCTHGSDCFQVSSKTLALDDDTQWLVVVVTPVELFSTIARDMQLQGHAEIDEMAHMIQDKHSKTRLLAGIVFAVMTLLSTSVGFCLTTMVAAPLRQLGRLMQRLSKLDFAQESSEFGKLMNGRRALITDVSELQDAFCRLSRAIETFSRFVPEPVVRNIVRGDERATRLHVDKRVVTIMFSDIRGFTSMSETLPLNDLVFLLTLYLSTMTRIVESYGGVVAEILGDGLLIFWNSGPEPCEDHEGKACAAALAMQEALGPLNADLSSIGLPELFVRIGVHTGEVLCGNIGSDLKMKFGCMGDPVNLASRLEGLCKNYGVGIICSEDTRGALKPDCGIITRRLDLAQVKGRSEPVHLYEIMGEDPGGAVVSLPTNATQDSCGSPAGTAMTRCMSTAAGTVAVASAVTRVTEVLRNGQRLSHIAEMKDRARRLEKCRGCQGGLALGGDAQSLEATARERRDQSIRYERALDAYQRADFAQARDLAQSLSNDYPADTAATWLLEQARRYLGGPGGDQAVGLSSEELAAWRGVSVMADK